MAVIRLSNCFNKNLICLKIFGLWQGRNSSKYYKYYSIQYLFVMLFIYDILFTLNIIYTPRTVEVLIVEVLFYFTEIVVVGKVSMILLKRKQILEAFDLLDCEFFKGDDDVSKKIIEDIVKKYSICYNAYTILCNFTYLGLVIILPLVISFAFGADFSLPIVQYYFLSDETREEYFVYLYLYQFVGMFSHLFYNLNIDTFMSGIIAMAITQLKILNQKLCNIKLGILLHRENKEVQEKNMYNELVQCLKHYDHILQFCALIQDILNLGMFIQFGVTAAIVCVLLCGLTLLPSGTKIIFFIIPYLMAVVCEVFVPGLLGAHLTHEHQELVFAAYNSDWIPQSEKFKRSLRLFVTRANIPMVLTGYTLFPLALGTFISIMKFSYSSFTLVRNVRDQQ